MKLHVSAMLATCTVTNDSILHAAWEVPIHGGWLATPFNLPGSFPDLNTITSIQFTHYTSTVYIYLQTCKISITILHLYDRDHK